MIKPRIILILFLLIGAFEIVYGQGCSQCKLVAEQSSELDESSFGSNINYGIIYLMLAPYLLLILVFRKKIAQLIRKVAGK